MKHLDWSFIHHQVFALEKLPMEVVCKVLEVQTVALYGQFAIVVFETLARDICYDIQFDDSCLAGAI